jgi:acyl-coenzyme A thioesterase PaaI-like protein
MSREDFRTAEAFDPKRFTDYASRVGHGGALGILYVGHGPDWVELALDYREALVGVRETGVIASGPIVSLMDMALSMAIWVKLGRFRAQATLDMRVDYLRPADARATHRRPGRMLQDDPQHRLRPRPRP